MVDAAMACVLGDLDLVAPLARTGIRCSIVAPPGDPARYSRKARVIGWADPRIEPERLLAILQRFGRRQTNQPVLFFQTDQQALFVARHRDELAQWFRFVIAEGPLLRDLLDKLRFKGLAERLSLPVPASCTLDPREDGPAEVGIPFPLLAKPATRDDFRWTRLERHQKAIRFDRLTDLEAQWPRLRAYGGELLFQELVPGPETRIESYHCYASGGAVIAEFTGRKLRTKPAEFGHSTALAITSDHELTNLGRQIVATLRLSGVAKLDFKRAPDGTLRLLEVNPRFNLWHHPAALAGVNLPALVWADLTGSPRPSVHSPTREVYWMSPWDLQAALEQGVPLLGWLPWAWRCDAKSMFAWDDPLPFLRLIGRRAARKLRGARPSRPITAAPTGSL